MAEQEALEQQGGGPKSDPPKPDEGIPPWMATFADMVTLLLCFFVLLLSFTNQDITNFRKLMGSIQEALGVQYEDSSALSTPYAETTFQERQSVRDNRQIVELGVLLKKAILARDLTHMAKVSTDKSGVMLRLSSQVLFAKGSIELTAEARQTLQMIIDSMQKTDFNVVIRGHTDGETPESNLYDSNWDLSAARAARCLRYILEHSDIPATRMKAVGYGGSKPLLPSTSEENRNANRRVEFFYLPPGRTKW
ncbi:OmpA family protein [Pseudodesulfovibrio thermohalotolerans]|uniref:OmpA/MotB family protein n=1 Tax=Pseudodesulfovibrio thermohalotolerans TaxID=2880651 RepID=UPI0024416BDB|nr:OmpA family protein [Pseudodesulfovibrio thermohalotolerans]WFS64240.1 OmpA family protein [Pseudodesulfovibrio thermohalotolerans]